MTKQKHYHAIPAALRGSTQGRPPVIITTKHGDIEEGCVNRLTTVFSDEEKTDEQLDQLLEELATEYEAHIKLAEEVIGKTKAGRSKFVQLLNQDALDKVFAQFLKGDIIGLHNHIQANKKDLAKLRTYTNGKVEDISNGTIRIKRDNNQSRVTLIYGLPTKLKVGDHVFIRDNGVKGLPTAMAVWPNVKDAVSRADELKQFF